jgi:hypothetical protein
MILRLTDVHPKIADVLKAREWQLRFDRNSRPEDAGARQVLGRRWKVIRWRILAAVPIGGIIGAAIAEASGAPSAGQIGIAFMAAYLSAIGTGVVSVLSSKLSKSHSIAADEMRALSTGLELGKPERAYLDTICALMEAGDNVSDETGREILSTLNELLDQAIYVEDRSERLRNAASTESVNELEAERARMSARLASAQDPQAKVDFSHSLQMCDDRLRNARVLAPLIERLDAQREVIHQTLLSVLSSVSRLEVAPTAVSAPDVEEVKRVVEQVTAQTQAVEDAVQQVIALR